MEVTRRISRSTFTILLLTACSGAESSPSGGPSDSGSEELHVELRCDAASPSPTYEELKAQVLTTSCAACHHGGANGVTPDMSSAESLRDVVSPRYAGTAGMLKIVDPGAPDNSTMMLKVLGGAGKDFAGPNGENVGAAMPQVGSLSAAQKDAIRNWICAGANP